MSELTAQPRPNTIAAMRAPAALVAEGSKECTRCGLVKPVDEFAPISNRPGKYNARCRACLTAVRTTPKRKETAKAKRIADRAAAIALYGGRCESCGLDDSRFLEFDHVNDDGGAHRKIEGVIAWTARIARSGERDPQWELALLCMPCHRGIARQRRAVGRPA